MKSKYISAVTTDSDDKKTAYDMGRCIRKLEELSIWGNEIEQMDTDESYRIVFHFASTSDRTVKPKETSQFIM